MIRRIGSKQVSVNRVTLLRCSSALGEKQGGECSAPLGAHRPGEWRELSLIDVSPPSELVEDPEGILGPPKSGHISRLEFRRKLEKDADAREELSRQVREEHERRRALREEMEDRLIEFEALEKVLLEGIVHHRSRSVAVPFGDACPPKKALTSVGIPLLPEEGKILPQLHFLPETTTG
ncbi:hypothetical protein KSP39_PZI023578 [Platanthera zijinensis]|uniref:Uncharacterized protein n=1 Tax=Platanthera zijinensis TaxID=2320716 RepID=A0AAP0FTT3_9ASPA